MTARPRVEIEYLTTLPVALREVRNLIRSTAPVSDDGAQPAAAVEAAKAGG